MTTVPTTTLIKIICAPRFDGAAEIVLRETKAALANWPAVYDDAWWREMMNETEHSRSRAQFAVIALMIPASHPGLRLCWRLLAVDPQQTAGLRALIDDVGTAIRGLDFSEYPQLLPRLKVWRDVADGKHAGQFGSLWHLASVNWMEKITAAPADDDEDLRVSSGVPVAVELLHQVRWDDALAWLWNQTDAAVENMDRLLPVATHDDRATISSAILELVEHLFVQGYGEHAIAWQMMAADPRQPGTFHAFMPQLQFMLDHRSIVTNPADKKILEARITVWWEAAAGQHKDSKVSIFRIADRDTENIVEDAQTEWLSAMDAFKNREVVEVRKPQSSERGIVVLPSATASKIPERNEFHSLLDVKLPLMIARDVVGVRRTLLAEYPHAQREVDLIVRDLREGEPVRLKPILICGPFGCGKSRVVRRLGELLSLAVHRFDGAGAHDGMYGGSPKAWSNATASVPARAVNQTRIANPILLVDEIDKAGSGNYNGRLWDAAIPFLERETSTRFRDPGMDAEIDLSWVSHIATANDATVLPGPLLDRYRVVKMAAPGLEHLDALAPQIMAEIARERDIESFVEPLAGDELDVIARAWKRSGLSIRNLQKIVGATLDARDAMAARH
jgi:hypothetical protein